MKNSKISIFAVEALFSNQWHTLTKRASKKEAQLFARLKANESPLHAIRIREIIFA